MNINDDNSAWPKEAVPIGTLVRSIKKDSLGIVADAYYGEEDTNNKGIIIYTILLIPDKRNFLLYTQHIQEEKIFMINEYEYDIYAYLMVPPLNFNALNKALGGVI